jgi:hypothetical protein
MENKAATTTKNYYAPLRTVEMETTECEEPRNGDDTTQEEQQPRTKAGRSPPVVQTTATNLIYLQAQLESLIKGKFELRVTRNGTRVVTQDMGD